MYDSLFSFQFLIPGFCKDCKRGAATFTSLNQMIDKFPNYSHFKQEFLLRVPRIKQHYLYEIKHAVRLQCQHPLTLELYLKENSDLERYYSFEEKFMRRTARIWQTTASPFPDFIARSCSIIKVSFSPSLLFFVVSIQTLFSCCFDFHLVLIFRPYFSSSLI